MNYKADFLEGAISFTEAVPPTPNLKHLQGAMFMDRPDLWPVKRRKNNGKPVPPEQQALFRINEKGEVDGTNDSSSR